jgi:hypothetical protein
MKAHPFDPVSFAFGLLFLVTGAALASGEIDLADLTGRGILVLPVLFVGVLLVAVGIRRLLGDRDPAAAGDAPAAGDTPAEQVDSPPEP